MTDDTGAPKKGVWLGRIRLGELIGEGGTARVYAAKDGGRDLAVKVLRQTRGEDGKAFQRLLREARIISQLSHSGLVKVYSVDVTPEGHPYLVMDRVMGESLEDRLKGGPLSPEEAWRIVRAAAMVLLEAHDAGVLHRDIKPSNLLLDTSGTVRISDFGLALEDLWQRREGAQGSPAYMAPEQWRGERVDVRVDVYGLGAVLYESLCGDPPWYGDPADLLYRFAASEPEPLSRRTVVPREVEAFVGRCLSREAKRRPEDITAFIIEGDTAFGFE